MSKIIDRYTCAVHSSNLKSKPDTTYSDPDVLGAAGLAGRKHPLALALTRLLAGDNHASATVLELLADMAHGKAHREKVKLKRTQAQDMAKAVLSWYRHGTCKPCGGHGHRLIPGTRTLSDADCPSCKGSGKLPFDKQFPMEQILIARWLLAEMERELAKAGPEAMKALAPSLNLEL